MLRLFLVAFAMMFVAAFVNIAKYRLMSISGQVVYANNTQRTVTLKDKQGEVTIAADQIIQVTMGKEKRTFGDLKAGDKVKITYVVRNSQATSHGVRNNSLPCKTSENFHCEQVHDRS